MSALSPRSGIQVSPVYPTYTHIKGQCPLCVCVCVCVAKPVAVELRCHATALICICKNKDTDTLEDYFFSSPEPIKVSL